MKTLSTLALVSLLVPAAFAADIPPAIWSQEYLLNDERYCFLPR